MIKLQTDMQKGQSQILIIGGLLLVMLVAGAYYLGTTKNRTQYSNKAITNQPISSELPPDTPPPYYSPKPIPSEILSAITVVPINASKFKKSVVDTDQCTNPIGLVRYSDQNSNSMLINSLSLPGNASSRDSLSKIQFYLNGIKSFTTTDRLDSLDFAFRDYCGGGYSFFIRELTKINYPKMDKAKALLILGGNGSIDPYSKNNPGSFELRIYAQHGDNIIMLSNFEIDKNKTLYDLLGETYVKSCVNSVGSADIGCLAKGFAQSSQVEIDAQQAAQQLIQLFAIQ